MTKKVMARIAVLGFAFSISGAAHADLVVNGGFESSGGNGQLGFNTFATGWSVPNPPGSYTFLFTPGTADTSGATGQFGPGLELWGPGNGVNNGLPATSPAGGNFIAQDSAFQQGAISQTILGLTAGQQYQVGFWWAAAQQQGFDGATFSQWQVSLGSQTQSTAFLNIPSHGFSGWQHQTFTFTADNTSDVLSFFANGGPSGVPPFALLDGVTMNSVPEASSVTALFAFGLLSLFLVRRARARKSAS